MKHEIESRLIVDFVLDECTMDHALALLMLATVCKAGRLKVVTLNTVVANYEPAFLTEDMQYLREKFPAVAAEISEKFYGDRLN